MDVIELEQSIYSKIPVLVKELEPQMENVRLILYDILLNVEDQLITETIPKLSVRSRSKSNLFLSESGFWSLGTLRYTKKTLKTKGGSKELLRLVHVISYLIEQIQSGRTSTLRELYYCALNWIDEAQFEKVNDSNLCLENIEILTNLIREELSIFPGEEGKISGPIVVEFKTRKKGVQRVDCAKDIGSSGLSLPRSITELKVISTTAKFILVVETAGMHARLIEEQFDIKNNCIIVCSSGQASRMTRKFLKLMKQQYNLPIAIFADCDAFGFQIAYVIKIGSIKASHLSELLCVPDAIHVGLLPSQIKQYNLPTDNITKLQRERLELMMVDTRFDALRDQMKIMLDTGKKSEQQALAYYGLDYVSKVYLPRVLTYYGFL